MIMKFSTMFRNATILFCPRACGLLSFSGSLILHTYDLLVTGCLSKYHFSFYYHVKVIREKLCLAYLHNIVEALIKI